MTALQNNYYSMHHRAIKKGVAKEHSEERGGKKKFRLQVQLEKNGSSSSRQS